MDPDNRPHVLRIEDGWVLDAAVNAAERLGAHFLELSSGPPSMFWVRQSYAGGSWMKRRQATVYCDQCTRLLPAGPDYWEYCAHHQPARKEP